MVDEYGSQRSWAGHDSSFLIVDDIRTMFSRSICCVQFLYGQEYEREIISCVPISVQIPLWSMNTGAPLSRGSLAMFRFLYGRWILFLWDIRREWLWVQIPLWSMNTFRDNQKDKEELAVQIPLWSMNTHNQFHHNLYPYSSDSSMVDEYSQVIGIFPRCQQFRFLYGRWILESWLSTPSTVNVQIPLWSMNTMGVNKYNHCRSSSDSSMVDEYKALSGDDPMGAMFRFLYGRWIPTKVYPHRGFSCVQIPLWSMNTYKR